MGISKRKMRDSVCVCVHKKRRGGKEGQRALMSHFYNTIFSTLGFSGSVKYVCN